VSHDATKGCYTCRDISSSESDSGFQSPDALCLPFPVPCDFAVGDLCLSLYPDGSGGFYDQFYPAVVLSTREDYLFLRFAGDPTTIYPLPRQRALLLPPSLYLPEGAGGRPRVPVSDIAPLLSLAPPSPDDCLDLNAHLVLPKFETSDSDSSEADSGSP
jgi:hypothetical protein